MANPRWSIVNSPNTGFAPTLLSALTCVGASDCWTVGRSEIGQTYTSTTFMRWNGQSWQVVPSPSVDKRTNGLVAIACLSSSSCWAVGYTIDIQTVSVQTLILRWDGTSWTIAPSPNVGTGFNALYGVACTAETSCWAVGFENGGSQAKTLIEKWDGASWTVQTSPNLGVENNVLNGVTCNSASDCWAAGYSGVEGAKSALLTHWDGTSWTASTLPNQLLIQENVLHGITCTAASDCVAVGESYNGVSHATSIERWDGTSWTNAIAPNVGVDNYLSRISCASESDCWAVGHFSDAAADPSQFDQPLMLHWDGSLWSPSAIVPNLTTTYGADLSGVECASGSDCWAVGSIQPGGSNRSLIERWDGNSWTPFSAPDVPATAANYLDGMTCVSDSDCWAVGFFFYGNVARSMIQHWDGISWKVTDSPNTALDRNNYLGDVACISSSDCWAVGQSGDTLDLARLALSMHWNGTSWSIVEPSPVDTSQAVETAFEAISCISTTDCWAVGYSLGQDYQGLIEHWNGTNWVVTSTPPQEKSIFYGVACTSTADCTAVGVQWTTPLTGSALYQTLVEHWDGSSWSVVASPNTASDQDNILSSVSCATPSDCWAVGSANNYSQALLEHWDGTSWSMSSSPQTGNILNAVTCLLSSGCWAAGPYYTTHPPAQTLLQHWDGTEWAIANSPNTSPSQSNNLSGITCASATNCWAVGQHSEGNRNQTLILRYAPALAPASVVSRKVHGSAGPFDVDLTNGKGIECRNGGASGNYTLVFTFDNPLTNVDNAKVSAGTGNVSGSGVGSDAHQYIVNLTGVPTAQTLTVSLSDVADSVGNFSGSLSISMNVLVGDTNADRFTDAIDVSQTKSQSGIAVSAANFREDLNVDGFIDSVDVSLVKSKSGSALP
ncbi:MAG TPA: hypothetical protein VKS98_13780 [Chthoniobacterales bacterium]|nr:hypothetical protein [Chthoniobacterales bacterium]